MLDALLDNPTRLAGWLAFGAGAAACVWRATVPSADTTGEGSATSPTTRGERGSGPWCLLAAIQAAFVAEVGLGLRFRLHDAFGALLREQGAYGGRAGLQEVLIGLALALATIGTAALLCARRWPRDVRLAGLGSAAAAALFAVEAISLHRVDALMYAPLGPVKAIAWLWAAAAGIVVLAALRRIRKP